MSSVKITDSVYYVGVLNPNMRVFDIVMRTDYGTSYNSYIVKGTEKIALIETSHKTFFKHYLENIEQVCDPAKIDYVILNHNEPDHSGALAALMDLLPNATIVVSQAGSIYIKNITNRNDLKVMVAKDNDTLDLGGRVLRFINAPFLHWPDSMFTYDEKDQVLFSCDFLGAHYCEPLLFDYHVTYPEKYEEAFKGYYDAIFGPFPSYVQKGLEKIQDLPIEYICNSHGPIVTRNGRMQYVMEKYREWSEPVKRAQKEIPVFYCSAYGNTRHLAQAIADGIREILPDAAVQTFDIIHHDMAQMQARLNQSDAFAVGTPTINRDALPPVWELLSHVDAINCAKRPCLVFGSFGWSGEGIPAVISRLKLLKMNVFGDGFKVTFVPTEEDLQKAKELGKEFARSL